MKATRLLGVMLVLQAGMIMGQLTAREISPRPAYAQIPDAGAQRAAQVDELKALNEKMDKLLTLLESGKLQVVVAKPDEK